jgi:hypothetical protein
MQGRLGEDLLTVQNIAPVSRTASTTSGASIDCSTAGEALFTFIVGDIAAGTSLAGKVEESDDGSAWATVAGSSIVGLAATDDNVSPTVNVTIDGRSAGKRKKFLRASVTVSGVGAVLFGVDVKVRQARSRPVTNSPVTVFV